MNLNISSLYVSFLVCCTILSLFFGIKYLKRREININKFEPGWNEQSKAKTHQSKVIKTYRLSTSKSIISILLAMITIGITTYAIIGKLWISALIALLGLLAPKLWMSWYESTQKDLISSQMEKASETMGAVLRSSGGMVQALERAAQDVKDPVREELLVTAKEIRLGIPQAVAFINLANKFDIAEMLIISVGIDLQQQGMPINMANMLEQMQKNIRYRQAFREEIKILSTENKMAGYIVAAMPFLTLGIMRQFAPDFTDVLFTTLPGICILIASIIIIGVGVYWMMQIADLKDI